MEGNLTQDLHLFGVLLPNILPPLRGMMNK